MSLPPDDFHAFLAHVAEAPDDPFRRLVFADWLQDRDDPRADWFRHERHVWLPTWETWLVPDLEDCIRRLLDFHPPFLHNNRDSALTILSEIGSPMIPVLRAWLREAPGRQSDWVSQMLGRFAPPQLRPIPELISLLRDDRPDPWHEAVVDLGWHGPAASEAVPDIIRLRQFMRNGTVGENIVRSLERIGTPLEPIVAALMQWLPPLDTSPFDRPEEQIERTILALKPNPATVYANLQLQDAHFAATSLRILAAVAEGDHDWVIHAIAQYPRPRVLDAAMAIAARDPSLSLALVRRFGPLRQHQNLEIRRFAHRIGLLHSDREETVALLTEAMASDHTQIVADAERSLLNPQTESLELVEEVVSLLIEQRVSVPGSFVNGLRTMGKKALPVLRLLLGDGSAEIRRAAASSLYAAGSRGRLLLQDALEDPRKIVRDAAGAGLR